MSPRRPRSAAVAIMVAGLVLGVGASACAPAQPRSPEERLRVATEALAGVSITATLVDHELAATEAIADFGIEEGVRLVRVRILDELGLSLRLESAASITLARPPRVCLVGPYSAPDDAGLSDRCWGEPDLGALLVGQLATDDGGRLTLRQDHPIDLAATLRRGHVRCDYPPGDWQLEVTLEPMVDGSSVGPIDLPPVSLDVPWLTAEPLPLFLVDTRYCGLATAVYRDQGEPAVATHSPP